MFSVCVVRNLKPGDVVKLDGRDATITKVLVDIPWVYLTAVSATFPSGFGRELDWTAEILKRDTF